MNGKMSPVLWFDTRELFSQGVEPSEWYSLLDEAVDIAVDFLYEGGNPEYIKTCVSRLRHLRMRVKDLVSWILDRKFDTEVRSDDLEFRLVKAILEVLGPRTDFGDSAVASLYAQASEVFREAWVFEAIEKMINILDGLAS